MRSCPRCTQPLVGDEDDVLEVDRCLRCGGVFYDAGELHALTGIDLGALITEAVAEPVGTSALRCPAHDVDVPMLAFHLREGGAVEVDRCPECRGVWLDQGERESLEAMRGALGRARALVAGDGELDAEEAAQIRRLLRADDLTAMMLQRGVREPPWLTFGLTLVCLAMMGPYLSSAGRGLPTALDALALQPATLWSHPWTLLSHSVVHGGFHHLLANGVHLLALGMPLELYLGKGRFAALWVLGAIGGGLAHWAVDPTSPIPMVGASTSLSAIIVAFLLVLPNTKVGAARKELQGRAAVFVGIFALQQVGLAFTELPISWAGHLGGAAVGLLFAKTLGERAQA